MRVVDTDYRRKSVSLKPVEESKYTYKMPVQQFNELTGKGAVANDPMEFITAYAKRGGPAENFAEMVSFYAVGKLPKEQVELLEPLLR
jgi:hypothetical protein